MTQCYQSDWVKVTRASMALPSVVLLAAAVGSKVYPGQVHVLMIDSVLAPCRNSYMRPENTEIGAQGVCIWVMNIYLCSGFSITPVLPCYLYCMYNFISGRYVNPNHVNPLQTRKHQNVLDHIMSDCSCVFGFVLLKRNDFDHLIGDLNIIAPTFHSCMLYSGIGP